MASKMNPGMMMAKKKPTKMAGGGMPMVMKDGQKVPAFAADGVGKMKKGGMAGMHKMPDGKMMKDSAMKKMNMGGMAKGGGIEAKGKTKGKQITMKNGGKC